VIEVVVAGAGPNGLMLACELGLAGIRPMVLDPMPGPNPSPRVNRIVGQGVRILGHRGLYSAPTGTAEPPKPAPRSMFAGFALDLASVAVNLAWKLAAVSSGRVEPALVATYETERRPAAEWVIMHSRAQLALFRPGPAVTALRELFSELVTEPHIVGRLSDLLSNTSSPSRPDGRSGRCPPPLCWCVPMDMWPGHRRRPGPMRTNCA
jgi:2-polyprenyl-6-methoxyphenol hydroxylase-like FAD-dependent oxidoreductase